LKHQAIDVVKLYTGTLEGFEDDVLSVNTKTSFDSTKVFKAVSSHEKWNEWLTRCFKSKNINELVRVRYGLQLGMDDAVKKRLTTQGLIEMFPRWIGSIDKTIRKIVKNKKHTKDEKRMTDSELESYLRKQSY